METSPGEQASKGGISTSFRWISVQAAPNSWSKYTSLHPQFLVSLEFSLNNSFGSSVFDNQVANIIYPSYSVSFLACEPHNNK